MTLIRTLLVALLLTGCSLVQITDSYGNAYGSWYNNGDQYSGQLANCERQMNEQSVPAPDRKTAMRCCMWRNGVPIDDSGSCKAG
jgi:hypothetical protein